MKSLDLWMQRQGAVANLPEDPDAAVPAHFGDPLREQAALSQGAAISPLACEVVAVTGPERRSWLTTLSSQVLTDLAPGDGGVETLLLDAQGRITHRLAALDDGQRLLLVTQAGRAQALVEFLERMRFMLEVQVEVAAELVALGALGEGLESLAAGESALLWRDPWPGVVAGGTSYDVGLTNFRHPGQDYRAGLVLVERTQVERVLEAFLAASSRHRLAGSLAWEALRVEAGRPRWAREADMRAIPHELDWLRTAVHLTKGCYPGQETIARTLNLGRPPRRLTILQLDGLSGDLPAPGAAVRLGERVVGAVTSVVRHHELGPMALALVRRAVPVGEQLSVELTEIGPDGEPVACGRMDAVQEVLVSPEGRAQASPAERPGAGLRKGLLHQSREN